MGANLKMGTVALLLATLVALAGAQQASGAVTGQGVTGTVTPSDQPAAAPGPASLRLDMDFAYDGAKSPPVTGALIDIDDDIGFDTAGISECAALPSGATTAQAIAACPNSKIGSGSATFELTPNGGGPVTAVVTAFNGIPDMGNPRVLLHVRNDGFNTSGVYTGVLRPSVLGPDFGTRLDLTIGVNPLVTLTHLDVELGGEPEAVDDGYVSATCGDADKLWNFSASYSFNAPPSPLVAADTQECQLPSSTLTVTPGGPGSGTVTGPGINCPGDCTESYPDGTAVALVATPNAVSTFNGWGGDCTGTGACNLTMDADRSVSAGFSLQPGARVLTVGVSGSGTGTVTGPGIACPGDCSEAFADGSVVGLTATPGGGGSFTSWSGDCSGPSPSCSVTMSGADKTATASFAPPPRTLTVTKAGPGAGTITGPGINCPGDCSEPFPNGSPVTLTATAGAGGLFAGWSGACSGFGACTVVLTANVGVTGTFSSPLAFVPQADTNDADGEDDEDSPGDKAQATKCAKKKKGKKSAAASAGCKRKTKKKK